MHLAPPEIWHTPVRRVGRRRHERGHGGMVLLAFQSPQSTGGDGLGPQVAIDHLVGAVVEFPCKRTLSLSSGPTVLP